MNKHKNKQGWAPSVPEKKGFDKYIWRERGFLFPRSRSETQNLFVVYIVEKEQKTER